MKKLTLVLFVAVSILTWCSCNKLDIDKDAPDCIQFKIKNWEQDSTLCDSARVEEYTFQGGNVFLFNPGNCGADMLSDVFNTDCVKLGSLGGIMGNTKINNEEFSHAVLVGTTWEK